ncbi:MAG TPA: multicopper oxidase domain-containing protein [Acidimicrobiia bacterium]|nr:multicopper oxidase domain-containing protein [Acidimicrobiia bacterium]
MAVSETSSKTFDRFLLLLAVFGVLTVALAVVAAIRAPAGGAGGDGAAAAPDLITAQVELSEFAIDGTLAVPPGDVTFELANVGGQIHNLALEDGPVSADIAGGESTSFPVGELAPGTYTIFCAIPGHREAGMEAQLVVGDDVADHDTGHGDMSPEEMDMRMIESMLAFPAETEGSGNQPLEPTEVKADGTKVFDLVAEVIEWEVEPGKFVEGWAYNGQIPGPMIKVDVGDKLEINVTNNTSLGTDVHWHGISTPNDMDGVAPYTQDPIYPGETFTYAFEAERPAIGMYHAHLHSQISVPNGMFAVFQIGDTPVPRGRTISGIEIPEDLELSREIPMVLNDAGTIGLSLNGKSFPATEPYVVQSGEWIAIHYYNEGLQVHPMHLHQFPQLVFAKDGIPLEEPYWADTVNVAPGERYSVLTRPDRVGTWVWHCHILTHVEREEGMFGMVTAMIVEEG